MAEKRSMFALLIADPDVTDRAIRQDVDPAVADLLSAILGEAMSTGD